MFKTLMILLLVGAAFITGAWYNERHSTDPVSRAMHQAADRVETIRQDLVARQRHLQSRDAHRERMMHRFEQVLELIEQDMQNKQVACSVEPHDNNNNDHD